MTVQPIDLSRAAWQKSSYSASNGGQCVEVALRLPDLVAVRDSKRRDGSILCVDPQQWTSFVAAVKTDAFDPA